MRNHTLMQTLPESKGIYVLLIDSCREVILNCNEYHYQLLNLLGERYVHLYANSG
ncbi:MAG: hypothetical protein WC856_03135 [Methylococcaceae bacterium]